MTSEWYILDANHNPVAVDSLEKWAMTFRGANRRVDDTKVNDARISTVFLGLNHNRFAGAPILFETMVFGGPLDQEQERYETWADAKRGHDAMVERVKIAHDSQFD